MVGSPTNRRTFSVLRRRPHGKSRGSVHIDTAQTRLVACSGRRRPSPKGGDGTALACQAPCNCSGVEPACGAAIARSSNSQTRRAENSYSTPANPEPGLFASLDVRPAPTAVRFPRPTCVVAEVAPCDPQSRPIDDVPRSCRQCGHVGPFQSVRFQLIDRSPLEASSALLVGCEVCQRLIGVIDRSVKLSASGVIHILPSSVLHRRRIDPHDAIRASTSTRYRRTPTTKSAASWLRS
jgi:hypothetical protein